MTLHRETERNMRAIAIVLITLMAGNALSASVEKKQKPNIVIILVDDMGWKDVGYAGSTYYLTPHIDALASDGVIFTNAYSAAPVCTPSRGAIFSGKYPARTKLTTVFNGPSGPDDRMHDVSKKSGKFNQYIEAKNRHALPGTEVIIAEALKDGGYSTGFFGKWHIGECPGYYPDNRGFETAVGYRRVHGHKYGHFGDRWPEGNFANLPHPADDEFIPETLTDECVKFIKSNKDKPFFAVLSHYIVHMPITPRQEKVPKYRNRPSDDQDNPEYAALVESVDESVRDILNALKEMGIEKNTIVIFTSDNGGLTLGQTSNYPLMGGKSFPFEAGMKVPLIVKWPERIKPGIRYERVVGTDFYPTLLEAAGLPLRPEQHKDGLSLMPLLENNKQFEERPIIFHFPHYTHATGPFSSIIENDWKLIKFYNDEAGKFLLYNLANDPQEQNDQADENPGKIEKLNSKLSMMLGEMDAELPIKNPDFELNDENNRYLNLEYTKSLAEKERQSFEERIDNSEKL